MPLQFSDVMLGSIELFCLAAEYESFTEAANHAGLTPAAVSRNVLRLEQRLGVKLFVRTTRKIRLSEAGRNYYLQCKHALQQIVDAERDASGQQVIPAGILRVSMPTPFGHHFLLPLMPAFLQAYPQIQLDLQLSNWNVDFTSEGFDLAIRVRVPPDSGMIARKLIDAELVVVAAPAYLQQHGAPTSLEQLAQHQCIQFILPSIGQNVIWQFKRDGQELDWPTTGSYSISDDILGTVSLAKHGAGLIQTYRFVVEAELQSGQLCEVLQEFGGRSRPFSLLYPRHRHMPARLRVFIDFLMKACETLRKESTST